MRKRLYRRARHNALRQFRRNHADDFDIFTDLFEEREIESCCPMDDSKPDNETNLAISGRPAR